MPAGCIWPHTRPSAPAVRNCCCTACKQGGVEAWCGRWRWRALDCAKAIDTPPLTAHNLGCMELKFVLSARLGQMLFVFFLACMGTWTPATAAGAQNAAAPVTLLLQLTDLHISRFHHMDPKTSTSRVEDLELFGERLLSIWHPDGILVTGDLTDAKSLAGRGEQFKAEWREYKRVWSKLAEAAGLDESALQFYDIRGNHDAFDMVRGGIHDYYSVFSARAARQADEQGTFSRIYVDYLHPKQASKRSLIARRQNRRLQETQPAASATAQQQVGRSVDVSTKRLLRGVAADLHADTAILDDVTHDSNENWSASIQHNIEHGSQQVRSRALQQAGQADGEPQVSGTSCPSAVLVGIDATPNPGVRNPTNFLGVVGPDLLSELESELARVQHMARVSQCPPPVLISYGHHTFSTLAHGHTNVMGAAHLLVHGGCGNGTGVLCMDSDQPQATAGPQETADTAHATPQVPAARVEDMLRRWDVSAYLCGHLHDTFGLRTHKLYPKLGNSEQAVPHTTGAQLAELLLSDWKYSRWFRLMTIDPQAGLSFTDLQFLRDPNDQNDLEEPFHLRGVGHERVVSSHVVHITSPADMRYSYLASGTRTPGSAAAASDVARVMVLPTGMWADEDGDGDGTGEALQAVLLHWSCEVWGGLSVREQGSMPMHPSRTQPWVYEADLAAVPAIAACTDTLTIQVKVLEHDGRESCSERRAVRPPSLLSRIRNLQASLVTASSTVSTSQHGLPATTGTATGDAGKGVATAADSFGAAVTNAAEVEALVAQLAAPAPLGVRLSEHIVLTMNLATFGKFAFQLQWCVLLLLLLIIPRFLGQYILVIHSALHHLCFGSHAVWAAPRDSTSNHPLTSQLSMVPIDVPMTTSTSMHSHSLGHRDSFTLRGSVERESGNGHSFNSAGLPGSVTSGGVATGSSTVVMCPERGPIHRHSCSLLHHLRCAVAAVLRPVAWTSKNCVARPCAFLLLLVVWPFKDLARLATGYADLWWWLVAYTINLQVGPWFVGVFGTTIAGLGVLTSRGVWLPGPSGYHFHVLHDACIITNVHMTTAVLPGVLWLASVVAYWSDQAASKSLTMARLLTWRQILALFVLVPIHCRSQANLATFYGASAVLLAPCTGWTIPLAALWLRRARNRVNKSRLD